MNNKGSYPQQSVYPQQSTAPVYPPAMQVPAQVSPYPDAPPPYSEVYQPRYMAPPPAPGHLAQMTSAYPGTQMYMPMAQSVPMGAMHSSVPMAYYQMGPMYPPGSTVMVEGGYDAGARFGPGGTGTIPPPPPGHLPNAAQMAAMQGANVVMTQRKGNFFMGSGGGYTIW